MTPMFHAYDGTPFTTVEACLAHEKTIPEWALVGLTIDQVRDAMARRGDLARADAIEVIGAAIARDRRADGELKRQRQPSAAPPPTLAIAGPRTEPDAETAPESSISTGDPRTNPDDTAEAA